MDKHEAEPSRAKDAAILFKEPPIIGLLTDFGLADPYVGQMKAVLVSLAPTARIIDLCHQTPAHDVRQGGFFLAASLSWFPAGALLVAVVDPGVGSLRRVILLEKLGRFVLAPDNGLATLALNLPGPARAWDLTPSPAALDPNASSVFHGRDLFAPLAARLLTLGAPSLLGRETDPSGLVRLETDPPQEQGGRIRARVLHVDHFGAVVLNLDGPGWRERLGRAEGLELLAPLQRSLARVRSYAGLSPGALGILEGSQGYFELAMRETSAARELGLAAGDMVDISAQDLESS